MNLDSFFFKVNPIHDLKIPDKILKDLKANVTAERYGKFEIGSKNSIINSTSDGAISFFVFLTITIFD
jgi:hypothetical protein